MAEVFQAAEIINDDHTMASYINGNPFEALTQIIHNSLDANDNLVKVSVKYNDLGTLDDDRISIYLDEDKLSASEHIDESEMCQKK